MGKLPAIEKIGYLLYPIKHMQIDYERYSKGDYPGFEKFPHPKRDKTRKYAHPINFPTRPNYYNVESSVQLATRALLERLRTKTDDPWFPQQAWLYQESILCLWSQIARSGLIGEKIRLQALEELATLTLVLENLFLGKIGLRITKEDESKINYAGYPEINHQPKRVTVTQQLQDIYSPGLKRTIFANCEIAVKEVYGRSTRGGVIAGTDQDLLRIGLRCSGAKSSPWTISIDSGFASTDRQRWQTIRPLSQAISSAGLSRFYTPYTFHYTDRVTNQMARHTSLQSWEYFNGLLYEVFQDIAQAHPNPRFKRGYQGEPDY